MPAAGTAAFLERCARASPSAESSRFFYPCNAKHREPRRCAFAFRRRTPVSVATGPATIEVRVAECEYTEGGTGWRVWPCALLLACWVAEHESELALAGSRVLELGCGLGLVRTISAQTSHDECLVLDSYLLSCSVASLYSQPGLTAAALGSLEAVLTDCLPVLLRTIDSSVQANAEVAPEFRARVALLDWDDDAPVGSELAGEEFSTEQGVKAAQLADGDVLRDTARLRDDERFHLILASDVIYSMTHAIQLPRERATPDGRSARQHTHNLGDATVLTVRACVTLPLVKQAWSTSGWQSMAVCARWCRCALRSTPARFSTASCSTACVWTSPASTAPGLCAPSRGSARAANCRWHQPQHLGEARLMKQRLPVWLRARFCSWTRVAPRLLRQ